MNTPDDTAGSAGGWRLHNMAQVEVSGSVGQVWAALTEPDRTEAWLLGARASVGEAGGSFRLERADGWGVSGRVLVKEPPDRLRVSWIGRTPPDVAMPDVEIEFLIEAVGSGRARFVLKEYVDGPLPPALEGASRVGWAMMTRGLRAYFAAMAERP